MTTMMIIITIIIVNCLKMKGKYKHENIQPYLTTTKKKKKKNNNMAQHSIRKNLRKRKKKIDELKMENGRIM